MSESNAIKLYRSFGMGLSPGMDISFVVRDAKRWVVELS
jgi:hypothetical protein